MKTVICAIAKHENNYINDWCKYHLNLGFDDIYVFDNNESDYEDVASRLDEDIRNKVHFIDAKDKANYQCTAYNTFYRQYKNTFDWCAFIDIDEFFNLGDCKNISEFLDNYMLDNVDCMYFNWVVYGDDGIIEGDTSKPVYERIVKPVSVFKFDNVVKSLIKGGLDYDIEFNDVFLGHSPINVKRCITTTGRCFYACKQLPDSLLRKDVCINHYMTKTLKEFIDNKMNTTDAIFGHKVSRGLDYFFHLNKNTVEKQEFIRNYLNSKGEQD